MGGREFLYTSHGANLTCGQVFADRAWMQERQAVKQQ